MSEHDARARMRQFINNSGRIGARDSRHDLNGVQELKNKIEPDLLYDRVQDIIQWHHDRNLIDGSTDEKQLGKLEEEFNELKDSIANNKTPIDDIGDMIVVLINIAVRNNLSLLHCLDCAWCDIKDRKGRMIDGIFVKEADLHKFK